MTRRLNPFLIVAVALVLSVAAAPALAGKGGGGNGGGHSNGGGNVAVAPASISLGQSSASLGSEVNFYVAYPSGTKNPRIDVMCYQGDTLVYGEAGTFDHIFVLGGYASAWRTNGGGASCTARLFDLIWNGNSMQQVVWLASTTFEASA